VWRHNNPKNENQTFVGSFVNMILTRQTCGQRSSRAAESKRRALGINFSERICYMFLVSKCRGDQNLGLCTTSGLAFGEPRRCGDFQENPVFRRRKNRILPLKIMKKRKKRFKYQSVQDRAVLVILLNLVGCSFPPDHAGLMEMFCFTLYHNCTNF